MSNQNRVATVSALAVTGLLAGVLGPLLLGWDLFGLWGLIGGGAVGAILGINVLIVAACVNIDLRERHPETVRTHVQPAALAA